MAINTTEPHNFRHIVHQILTICINYFEDKFCDLFSGMIRPEHDVWEFRFFVWIHRLALPTGGKSPMRGHLLALWWCLCCFVLWGIKLSTKTIFHWCTYPLCVIRSRNCSKSSSPMKCQVVLQKFCNHRATAVFCIHVTYHAFDFLLWCFDTKHFQSSHNFRLIHRTSTVSIKTCEHLADASKLFVYNTERNSGRSPLSCLCEFSCRPLFLRLYLFFSTSHTRQRYFQVSFLPHPFCASLPHVLLSLFACPLLKRLTITLLQDKFSRMNLLNSFFVVAMLDHCFLSSNLLKERCRSKSVAGAMGAKDIAAVKERGRRLNLCLWQVTQHLRR